MTICQLPYYSYESENFLLRAVSGTGRTDISMVVKKDNINTQDYPDTVQILKRVLPDVLKTECFNDDDLPFSQEVKNTEIAHLLEHILLQLLYFEKTRLFKKGIEYNGNTRWNWKKDHIGTFYIEVDSGYSDGSLLKGSIKKAIEITEMILNSQQTEPINA